MASRVRARHLLIDLVDVPRGVCLNLPAWEDAFRSAATLTGMQILDYRGHFFQLPSEPGLTAFMLLDSSHFSVHTYADRGLVAVDLFACTDRDLQEAWDLVAKTLGLEDLNLNTVAYLDRFVEQRQ